MVGLLTVPTLPLTIFVPTNDAIVRWRMSNRLTSINLDIVQNHIGKTGSVKATDIAGISSFLINLTKFMCTCFVPARFVDVVEWGTCCRKPAASSM